MIIAVDFDKTLSLGDWPGVGPVNGPIMREILKRKDEGDKVILWTCRSGDELSAAVAWCRMYGLEFDAVNENLPETLEAWGYRDTRKVFADEYWDDKACREGLNDEHREVVELRKKCVEQSKTICELTERLIEKERRSYFMAHMGDATVSSTKSETTAWNAEPIGPAHLYGEGNMPDGIHLSATRKKTKDGFEVACHVEGKELLTLTYKEENGGEE